MSDSKAEMAKKKETIAQANGKMLIEYAFHQVHEHFHPACHRLIYSNDV